MANIVLYTSFDMHNPWYGTVTSSSRSPTTQTVSNDSGQTLTYSGSFTYNADGSVTGTLTGFGEQIDGQAAITVTGLNMLEMVAQQYIAFNNITGFLTTALSGNDQFSLTPGTNVIDGGSGYNTATEPMAYATYTIRTAGAAEHVTSATSNDTMYNIQGIYFADGFYDVASGVFSSNTSSSSTSSSNTPPSGITVLDTTTNATVAASPQTYSGPVAGIAQDFVSSATDSLNVTLTSDNWFIHTGSGTDAIAAHGGTNVLDGGTGSNFLTGGTGSDTFFVDDRAAATDIWSTVNNFHSGDGATIWGVTPSDFSLNWFNGQGAAGYTGLTLHATAAATPTASLTLVGFSSADLSNGRLSVSFGTTQAVNGVAGSSYMYVHAN